MFSSGRTILLMTDEALYIYTNKRGSIELVETVSWDKENIERYIAGILVGKCNNNPVIIVNDMVEQHYRKERVLTSGVSILDRKTMVGRKLNMAFPNYPVRAALPLKEKVRKEGGKMSPDIFIFAAIPETPQFNQTISAVNSSLSASKGVTLLPVESSDLVRKLSQSLRKGSDLSAQWVVFMGQHRNGSLRQIVTKNGEVALTRMTPLTKSTDNKAEWATEIAQEFKSTMSYLTRFGFQPEDGLDVILLSDPMLAEGVRQLMDERFSFHATTPAKAAKAVGLKTNIANDDYHADMLHVAWIGRKNNFILPMKSRSLDQFARPRKIARTTAGILMLSSAFLFYQMLSSYASLTEVKKNIVLKNRLHANVQAEYEEELRRREEEGIDVRLIQGSLKVFDELYGHGLSPLFLVTKISQALGKDMRFDAIRMNEIPKNKKRGNVFDYSAQPKKEYMANVVLQVSYPSTSDVNEGNNEIQSLAARLRANLKDYEVQVTKLLKDFKYVEEVTIDSGKTDDDEITQDYVAEITIKKPVPATKELY